jgi:hypothetical protein
MLMYMMMYGARLRQIGGNDMQSKAKVPAGLRTFSYSCNQSDYERRYGAD